MTVPAARLRPLHDRPPDPRGRFVLYWMTSFRRPRWNFALDRAVEWARELETPLVVLEALRAGYPWASDRHHRFVLEGMIENRKALAAKPVLYVPYVEREPGEGAGFLAALARTSAVVVTDDHPGFFIPRMLAAAVPRVPVRFEAVDANGLLPLRAATLVYPTAHAFRRFLQKTLPDHWRAFPKASPFARARLPVLHALPSAIGRRWPPAHDLLDRGPGAVAGLSVDHSVPAGALPGGAKAGETRWRRFLERDLARYEECRNHPDDGATSRLSAYLHFGHLSTHQIVAELMARERWEPGRQSRSASGSRSGWWGMSAAAEAFLDQLVTWRELGFNMAWHRGQELESYDALPSWALHTLEKHARDPRKERYTRDELEGASTRDPLWNAAQTQLVREGEIHNYLRMLWGKKILEWSPSPREALDRMIHLNHKYALDGRDPNSASGILWCLGRYDRPWGPERPIYGTVRYMTSANTARKLRVKEYLRRYAPAD